MHHATLTFTPGGTGARTAQLAYTDNATGSPHTIALSGSGTHRVTLAGKVTLNGNPVAGAAVEACPTGRIRSACRSNDSKVRASSASPTDGASA